MENNETKTKTTGEKAGFLSRLKNDKKTQLWVSGVVVFLLLAVVGGLLYSSKNSSKSQDGDDKEVVVEDVSATLQRKLDGVEVDNGKDNIYPVGVMIENLVSVRPQSGLSKAGVVYEALAEGGITRFLAVFASDASMDKVGPVRSARDYYVRLAGEYNAVYAHAGGSPEALALLQSDKHVLDGNALTGGQQQFFKRDTAIAAPHNLFTNSFLLNELRKNKNVLDTEGDFTGWKFATKTMQATEGSADATSIHIDFSSRDYTADYSYNAEDGVYERSNGGVAHTDALTKKQITVKNIVVQKTEVAASGDDKGRVDVTTTGDGNALIFINGKVTEGTWKFDATENRTRFYDAADNEVVFEPGNTWVEVVPSDRTVEYTAQEAQ